MKRLTITAIVSATLMLTSCISVSPKKYKYVVEVTNETHTYPVVITKYSGGNSVKRGAKGALIGGGVDFLLGGSGKSGVIVGGLIGASTTTNQKSESYTDIRTDIIYTITFNNGSVDVSKNYCHFSVGDSVQIF